MDWNDWRNQQQSDMC